MSRGVEIDLSALGRELAPGVRAEAGLEELRSDLEAAAEYSLDVILHFGGDGKYSDELQGRVNVLGAGVVVLERFGADDNERVIVPLNKIVWLAVKRRA
ncbi:MAG TPA: hypothetical protein VE476_10595 [Propionibacteriaceae bacterium]|jgi:hypothetical protein|nr:hypothetical protein [Propionibacteriaceae bacterium]